MSYLIHWDNVLPGDAVTITIDGNEHSYIQGSPFVRGSDTLSRLCAEINADDAEYTAEILPNAVSIIITGATKVDALPPLFQVRV